MSRTTARSIRESHRVMDRVMQGEVTPRCERAQRAARVVARYPLSAADLMEREERRIAAMHRRAPVNRRRVVASRPSPAQQADRRADQDALLAVVFGSAAPQARQAIAFLGTSKGQKVLGAGALAATALVIGSL